MSAGERERLVVDERFCGFAGLAHGGYLAGRLARLLGGPADVTFRRPAPLGEPLEVVRSPGGGVGLLRGEELLVEAVPGRPHLDVPEPVSPAEARRGGAAHTEGRTARVPRCFTCGPERAEGDGLRLFAGPVRGDLLAAAWSPPPSVAGGGERLPEELVWAALDCPALHALLAAHDLEDVPGGGIVTAQIVGEVLAPVATGVEHVVIAWPLGGRGRRLDAAAALLSSAGEVLARARSVWAVLRRS